MLLTQQCIQEIRNIICNIITDRGHSSELVLLLWYFHYILTTITARQIFFFLGPILIPILGSKIKYNINMSLVNSFFGFLKCGYQTLATKIWSLCRPQWQQCIETVNFWEFNYKSSIFFCILIKDKKRFYIRQHINRYRYISDACEQWTWVNNIGWKKKSNWYISQAY